MSVIDDHFDEDPHTTKFDTSTTGSRYSDKDKSDPNLKRTAHIPVLMVLEGDNIGERYQLKKRESIIGRREDCEIYFTDRKLSRNHCKITILSTGDNLSDFDQQITDLNSTNGTYINGKRLKGTAKLRDGDKILIGSTLLGFFLKFAEELDLENRLLKLATRDSLTNLYNRAFFKPTMNFEFKRSKRYSRDLSLILMDLDHFKNVNDTYGHVIGDRVLKEVGKVLLDTLRAHDIPVRYGGEEFAIILIESSLEQAIQCAERLRGLIEKYNFQCDGESFNITASFGVAFNVKELQSVEEMIRAADKALYHAKYAGRNNVKVYGESMKNATDAQM